MCQFKATVSLEIKKINPKKQNNPILVQQGCTKYVDGSTPRTRPILFWDPVSNAGVDGFRLFYRRVHTMLCQPCTPREYV